MSYLRSLCSPYSAFNVLPPETTAWEGSELSPDKLSTFDNIISLHQTNLYDASQIPEVCRRIALWSWTAQVHFNTNLVAEEVALGSPWQDRTVLRLVQTRLQLQRHEDEIHINMNALGIGTEHSIAQEWEAEDWRSLEDAIKAVERRIDVIYESYTQRASINESMAANQQARGVRYLTALAALFVPASLTAGIFAMAGEFSAGASRFWVFWAVSIPLMSILSVLFFAELFKKLCRKCFRVSDESRV
jgi:hypothetical protein